jgi:hypothetical protein
MKKLIALTQIITRQKISQINIVTNTNDNTLLGKFYRGIAEGKIKTIEDAENLLYSGKISRAVMNKMKDNLYSRLINTVFFIDARQSGFTDYQTAFYNVHKLSAAYQLLCNRGLDKENTIEIGENLLKKAITYDFSDIAVKLVHILSSTYAFKGDIKKTAQIRPTIDYYMEALRLETMASIHLDVLMSEYMVNRVASKKLSDKADEYYNMFAPHLVNYPTFKLAYYVYTIEIYKYGFINDFAQTLIVCNKAIAFFEQKGKGFNLAKVFYQQKLECCIYFGLYTEGIALQPKIQTFLVNGTHNWFKNQEVLIRLAFYTDQYEDAYVVFKESVNHPNYKKLVNTYQDFWKVCQVYIYVCVSLGLIKNLSANEQKKRFRLSTFVNNLPIYSYDKRGMNIPTIIAQVLYFLVKKDFDSVLNRIESIEKYCIRHLVDKDFDVRSYYFIKMLLTLPEANYNFGRVLKRSQGFKEKFDAAPENSKNIELEIMPYEKLWSLLLDLINPELKRKK